MHAAEPLAGAPGGEPVQVDDSPELFQIRAQLQTLLALKLIQPRDERFFLVLQQALARSPKFFRHAPIVVDAGPVAGQPPLNLAEFARRLRQQHLVPVGLQNGDEAWSHMAVNAGLALLPSGRPAKVAPEAAAPEAAAPSQPDDPAPRRNASIVVSEPVRAGQQIYAEDGDLIVLSPVSPGAEVAADGHVHVYSRLRGRLLPQAGGAAGLGRRRMAGQRRHRRPFHGQARADLLLGRRARDGASPLTRTPDFGL